MYDTKHMHTHTHSTHIHFYYSCYPVNSMAVYSTSSTVALYIVTNILQLYNQINITSSVNYNQLKYTVQLVMLMPVLIIYM